MKLSIAAVALMGAVSPAIAGGSDLSKPELIAKCVRQHGERHADTCVSIIDREAAGRRAIRNYYRGGDYTAREWEARERECWSNPKIINPVRCSNGYPPVYSD